jgi:hypothetical protein
VVEIHLDLQFPDELFGDFLLLQQLLLDHLQRADEPTALLPT